MAFDFKKEYQSFYLPARTPQIVTLPAMRFLAMRGAGDPNLEDGSFKQAVSVLYAVAYTIKMSKLGDHRMEGFFDFVVPPLEGFWQQEGGGAFDPARKDALRWICVIRVPDFVTEAECAWAAEEAGRKKRLDCTGAELLTIEEGLCVQILHLGPFDSEPASIRLMEEYAAQQGFEPDFSGDRLHHEIYLTDARRVEPEKWKTVIRHPIRRRREP